MRKHLLATFMALGICAGLLGQQPVVRAVRCVDAGSTDAYACASPSPNLGAYSTGLRVYLYVNTTNTGTASVDVSGLGAKTIMRVKNGITVPLITGDLRAGMYADLIYDGTNFQLLSQTGNETPIMLSYVVDGGGSVVTAATSTARYVDRSCSIDLAEIAADVSGSMTVIVELASYATTPSFSTISHASSFALSSAVAMRDTTLTGWTVAVPADSLIRISVTGTPATVTKAGVNLRCQVK